MYTIASTQRSKIVFRETEHRAAGAGRRGARPFGSVASHVDRVFLLIFPLYASRPTIIAHCHSMSVSYKYRIATSKSSHSDRMEARTHGMRSPGEEEHDP